MNDRIVIHHEVAEALRTRRPVVALESAVITTGLPREPLDAAGLALPEWQADQPVNCEIGRAMQRLVRDGGAIPATIAVLDGRLRIGLDDEDLQRFARDVHAKVSVTGLAHALATGRSAGTTVSATLAACTIPPRVIPDALPIRVFATGGIGGVHRNWTSLPDISADLRQLSRSPVCVVCAGAKSLLDLPATLEALETLGVPVIGYRTRAFPQFYTAGSNDLPAPQCVEDVIAAANTCRVHFEFLDDPGGMLLCNPIPADFALDVAEVEAATIEAERIAAERGMTGDRRTPFVLAELARLTDGRSLTANLALLANNANLAAMLARELSG